MFQKAMKKRQDAEAKRLYEKEAIDNLKKLINETNEVQFFDCFAERLDQIYKEKDS